jgi:hypothetical protein
MRTRSAFVAVAFLLTSVFSVSAQNPATPKLSIPSLEHSFGSVKAGTPLTYSIEIKNEGKEDLEIKRVNPSCG